MKVALIHNAYQQSGGEDAVVAAETLQLQLNGHTVVPFLRHNNELRELGILRSLTLGVDTIWGAASYRLLRQLLASEKPDVAHFHNTFPLISPSAYYACVEAGVPVIQTLHNYRLLCPAATLFRDGAVCESCLGKKVAWPGVLHACYRDSFLQTSATAAMLTTHKFLGTWQNKVTTYIALSEFAREKFIQGGLLGNRIVVKPNSVSPDPGAKKNRGDYALYVGRLAEEKGIRVLLDAWDRLPESIPLVIAGDGPLMPVVQSAISRRKTNNVKAVGHVSPAGVLARMRDARFLIFPSLWFEGFPMTVAESFASGLPVIASDIGSLRGIVEDSRVGLRFRAGDSDDLAVKAEWAWNHPDELVILGARARAEFEAKYTAERNYRRLVEIYHNAIDAKFSRLESRERSDSSRLEGVHRLSRDFE